MSECSCERLRPYGIQCRPCYRATHQPCPPIPHSRAPERAAPMGQLRFMPRGPASKLDRACRQGLAILLLVATSSFAQAQCMDLPMPPVKLGDPPAAAPPTFAPPPEPDDPGDDPRDTPPPVFYGEEIDTETDSIIFVIDISGSMNVDGRMQRAQAELIRSVNGLASCFRFNAIAYSDVVYEFAPRTLEANPLNKAALAAWILNYNARGATATGPAVAQALSDRSNLSVVLLTDGFPNFGVPLPGITPNTPPAQWLVMLAQAHRRVIRQANAQGASIDVFGIATFAETRAFCQGVASDSGGRFTDVP